MSTTRDDILKNFDMLKSPGLIYVKEKTEVHVTPYERIALENAERLDATAVYFRKFPNNERPSIPQIYIYDFTSIAKRNEDVAEIHKNVWNSAQVPLVFVFHKHQVQIFNTLRYPDYDHKNKSFKKSLLDTIVLAAETEEIFERNKQKYTEFSGRKIDNGSFWEQTLYKDRFKFDETVYKKLLDQLIFVRNDMIDHYKMTPELTNRLLMMIILIKYLEERQDEKGGKVFPKEFFQNYKDSAKGFSDILREEGGCVRLLRLFDSLSNKFNGKIFELTQEEKDIIGKKDLDYFADFLDGKIRKRQYIFWPDYSFNYLPVELISNIYEVFLKKEEKVKGIVYTPPHLVNFLLDECMPLTDTETDFKILDPACGSGIFLVSAYKRLVFRWRLENNWEKPSQEILKKLLKDNIYGVDKESEAVLLTAFSLSIALCDMLSPKEIWEDLRFDNLFEKNLHSVDFFELVIEKKLKSDFDLVIGNPPFIPKTDFKGAAKRIEDLRKKERPPIPNKQIALLFLEQSIELCKENGLLCMIQSAGPFLYNKHSANLRKYYLSRYNTIQIIDFTLLQNELFKGANVSTVAVFTRKEEVKRKNLLHVIVRRTKSSKEKLFFELDYYDFNLVGQRTAQDDNNVWKSNLFGGGRLLNLIQRLGKLDTLGRYLKDKIKNKNWVIGEGYKLGEKKDREKIKNLLCESNLSREQTGKLERLLKVYKEAEHITNKRLVPYEAFEDRRILEDRITKESNTHFLFPCTKKKNIFKGPHILIKETANNVIPIVFREDDLVFKHDIIGIHSPEYEICNLRLLIDTFRNNERLFFFLINILSGRISIGRSTSILKSDIELLPYPKDKKELKLFKLEKILVEDVIDYMIDFIKYGEKSIVNNVVTKEQLSEYSKVYREILNTVYKNLYDAQPIETESFICYPFYFKEKADLKLDDENIEKNLNQLLNKEDNNANLRIIRIMKIYDKNAIYIIKPKQLRYWLKSIAIRDADDTFADLIHQGY